MIHHRSRKNTLEKVLRITIFLWKILLYLRFIFNYEFKWNNSLTITFRRLLIRT